MNGINNSTNQNENVTEINNKQISKILEYLFGFKLFKLISILFIIVGGVGFIGEYTKAIQYEETIGTFENYGSCNESGCEAIYSYKVNGETYYASPDLISDSFKETAKVYYNPESPFDYVMNSNWHILFISGCVFLIIYEIISKKIKNKTNKEEKSSTAINI